MRVYVHPERSSSPSSGITTQPSPEGYPLFFGIARTFTRRASSSFRVAPPNPHPQGNPNLHAGEVAFKGGGWGSVVGQYLWVGDQILKKPGKWGYAIGATARPMRTQPEHTPNCVTSRHGSRCRAPIPGKGRAELFIQAVLSAASPHQGGRVDDS